MREMLMLGKMDSANIKAAFVESKNPLAELHVVIESRIPQGEVDY